MAVWRPRGGEPGRSGSPLKPLLKSLAIVDCVAVLAAISATPNDARARADRATTLDVGPATAQLAATFENLRQIDRSLAGLALEHRGGARALGRVMTGETDAVLLLALAPFTDPLTAEVIASDALDLVPFFSEDIVLGAARRKMPYVLRQIRLGPEGWLSSGRPYHTTCTSIGAVVNAQADARLSEKVAQILLSDSAARAPRAWYAVIGGV